MLNLICTLSDFQIYFLFHMFLCCSVTIHSCVCWIKFAFSQVLKIELIHHLAQQVVAKKIIKRCVFVQSVRCWLWFLCSKTCGQIHRNALQQSLTLAHTHTVCLCQNGDTIHLFRLFVKLTSTTFFRSERPPRFHLNYSA